MIFLFTFWKYSINISQGALWNTEAITFPPDGYAIVYFIENHQLLSICMMIYLSSKWSILPIIHAFSYRGTNIMIFYVSTQLISSVINAVVSNQLCLYYAKQNINLHISARLRFCNIHHHNILIHTEVTIVQIS